MPRPSAVSPGDHFGFLVALHRDGNDGAHAAWRFRCECGKEIVLRATSVKTGNTRSCGCALKGRRPTYKPVAKPPFDFDDGDWGTMAGVGVPAEFDE